MNSRLSIVAGLVVGVAVAALALGGLLVLVPDPPPPATPSPPIVIATASPSATVSAPPSASPGPSASSARRLGRSAPGPEAIVRDGALGGIGPDVMATGLETILPGVDVTP